MQGILSVILRKSSTEAILALLYFILVGFLKWHLAPTLDTLFFFTGAVLGMYFLEIAEAFFHLSPSPFRSIVFGAGLLIVSVFVITSTVSMLGRGLVLSLSFTLIFWQLNEWRTTGNLKGWYSMVSGPISYDVQRWILAGFIFIFFVETFLFLR